MRSAKTTPFRVLLAMSIACVAATLIACKEPQAQATPAAAIQAFYAARIASGAAGTPSIAELERLAPLISVELHDLLREALLQHHKISSRTVQRGRSFVEGDLFSSLFDGPTSLTIGDVEALAGGEFLVAVKLTSAKRLPALSWTDKVRVVHERGHYVIADIEYGNHWAFGSDTRLVTSLRSAIEGKRGGKV